MAEATNEQRFRKLESYAAAKNSSTDVAVQYQVWERSLAGLLVPTNRFSPVYGGRLDNASGRYTGEGPDEWLLVPCHIGQIEFVEEDRFFSAALGGRGGGKSEASKLKALRSLVENPGLDGMVVAPTYDLVRNVFFSKLLPAIPQHWITGVNKSTREIELITGSILRARSAGRPDSLRSWGCAWVLFDEDQDCSDEAHDVAMLTMRETDTPQLYITGTPKFGEFYDRIQALEASPSDSSVYRFPSLENVFISPVVFQKAAEKMNEKRYRQEVLAEFVSQEGLVYHQFDRNVHIKEFSPDLVKRADRTEMVLRERFGAEGSNVGGLDYNVRPMAAVIGKVLESALMTVYIHDEIVIPEDADPWKMAEEMRRRGYAGMAIFDDASGEYSSGGKASSAVMRDAGFTIIHGKKNPRVEDRVNAVSAKLRNAYGEVSLLIHPRCVKLRNALEGQAWDRNGRPDKSSGHDHILDALGYLVNRLFPAHRINHRDAERTPLALAA